MKGGLTAAETADRIGALCGQYGFDELTLSQRTADQSRAYANGVTRISVYFDQRDKSIDILFRPIDALQGENAYLEYEHSFPLSEVISRLSKMSQEAPPRMLPASYGTWVPHRIGFWFSQSDLIPLDFAQRVLGMLEMALKSPHLHEIVDADVIREWIINVRSKPTRPV